MPRAEANGISLRYLERSVKEASGTPAVLVHGLGGSADLWRRQLDALALRRRALAYDQRGAGLSDKPPGPYSLEQWVADLEGLLEALGIGHCALVGHSVGCMVVQRFAAAHPKRVTALVLCGGAARWPDEAQAIFEKRAGLARAGAMDEVGAAVAGGALTATGRSEQPGLEALFVAYVAQNDPHGYAESALATATAHMDDYERVRCPALALVGAEDPVTPPEAARRMAALLPDARVEELPGAAHWPMVERPLELSVAIARFLDLNDPGGSK